MPIGRVRPGLVAVAVVAVGIIVGAMVVPGWFTGIFFPPHPAPTSSLSGEHKVIVRASYTGKVGIYWLISKETGQEVVTSKTDFQWERTFTVNAYPSVQNDFFVTPVGADSKAITACAIYVDDKLVAEARPTKAGDPAECSFDWPTK